MIRTSALVAAVAAISAGPALAQSGPTDPQIAHIAYTAGKIDADTAKLALAKSQNAAVREFAQTMARDHEAVNSKALELVKKLGVTPEANETSEALVRQAEDTHRRLSSLQGPAFDRAYAENEVAFHKAVNSALETTLVPSADNADLKALLETGLTLFTEHQAHAEHLAGELE